MSFPRQSFGAPTGPVIIGQQDQMLDRAGYGDRRKALIAQHGPDRDVESDHRGKRGFDAFREPKDMGRRCQHDGPSPWPSQQPAGIAEVPRPPRPVRLQEGSLNRNDATSLLYRGKHCRAEDNPPTRSQRCAGMETDSR